MILLHCFAAYDTTLYGEILIRLAHNVLEIHICLHYYVIEYNSLLYMIECRICFERQSEITKEQSFAHTHLSYQSVKENGICSSIRLK